MTVAELNTVSQLVIDDIKLYDPEKIYVFGSYACGQAKEHSDLDVLVIKDTPHDRFRRVREVFDLLYPSARLGQGYYKVAIDPLVLTPSEVTDRLNVDDFFVRRILSEGKLIYER